MFSQERDVSILCEILQLLLQGGVVGSCLHKIKLELKFHVTVIIICSWHVKSRLVSHKSDDVFTSYWYCL